MHRHCRRNEVEMQAAGQKSLLLQLMRSETGSFPLGSWLGLVALHYLLGILKRAC